MNLEKGLLRPRIARIKRILPSACMRGQKIREIRVIRGSFIIREIRVIRGSFNPCNPFNPWSQSNSFNSSNPWS